MFQFNTFIAMLWNNKGRSDFIVFFYQVIVGNLLLGSNIFFSLSEFRVSCLFFCFKTSKKNNRVFMRISFYHVISGANGILLMLHENRRSILFDPSFFSWRKKKYRKIRLTYYCFLLPKSESDVFLCFKDTEKFDQHIAFFWFRKANRTLFLYFKNNNFPLQCPKWWGKILFV